MRPDQRITGIVDCATLNRLQAQCVAALVAAGSKPKIFIKMKTFNNIHKAVFAVLGAACLIGIIAAGAWWHVGSLAICYFMFNAYEDEEEDINNQ